MPIVQADRLSRIGAALLKAAGASDEEAGAVAVGCVSADLAGHDSHGVIAIPTYIDRVKAGHIVPGAKWTIVRPEAPIIVMPKRSGPIDEFELVCGQKRASARMKQIDRFT
jgi:LDH2 family malate/lactate/ureidoglycolate dehydrogenase